MSNNAKIMKKRMMNNHSLILIKMKVHIVYCHPSDESVTYTLKEAYIDGLKGR